MVSEYGQITVRMGTDRSQNRGRMGVRLSYQGRNRVRLGTGWGQDRVRSGSEWGQIRGRLGSDEVQNGVRFGSDQGYVKGFFYYLT